MLDRKDMVRKYKETARPAGVFLVRHTPSGRMLLGASPDAPAMLNRIRAELRMRGHRNRALQADWDRDGADAFELQVLDLLPAVPDAEADPADELVLLAELWREKLELDERTSY